MKTHSKIAFRFFVLNISVVLMFGGAIYYFLNEYSYIDFYKRLETRATIAAKYNFESDKLNARAFKSIREQHFEKLSKEREYLIKININDNLKVVSEKYNLPVFFLQQIQSNRKAKLKKGNTFYVGINYVKESEAYIVVVSADHYYASHHLAFLRNILLAGGFFIALLTIYFSFYFSKNIFTPIKRITGRVKEISTNNIHLRLDENKNNDEISELAATFNNLLSRIETAFETQKNFISNASHELGTPLTAIIGEADVALIKERKPAEYQEVLKKIAEQAERLDSITKSLLFLAQTGYSGKSIVFEVFRIDDLIWKVKETIGKLNLQNDIYIDSSLFPDDPQKLKIKGNKQLMHLAIANVLNNACKYSHNKRVTVSIAASDRLIIVVVKDMGVGIPESEVQFIYDPFFRASNTGYFEGYGIGLPLSKNIITLHYGSIQVSSVLDEGTTVTIKLPMAQI